MSLNSKAVLLALLVTAARAGAEDPGVPVNRGVLGKVLVLDSERCLAGDVEVVGEEYCVRQGEGEIWIKAARVLRVCPDWKSAYLFVKNRANLDDPDERLRLARWC